MKNKFIEIKPVKDSEEPTMTAKIASTVLITCISALVIAVTAKLIMKMFGWEF